MAKQQCGLCGKKGVKLVESHVIPRAFYRDITNPDRPFKLLSDDANVFPKTSRTGVYDRIVCIDCERLFGPWDDYVSGLLFRNIPDGKTGTNTDQLTLYYSNFDRHKLRMFFLSLLWRAHASDQDFFSAVDVGPHSASIAEALLTNDPNKAKEVDVLLTIFATEMTSGFLCPIRERNDYFNCYRFCFPGFSCLIKVDQRPFTGSWKHFGINNSDKIYLLVRSFQDSPEFAALREAALTVLRRGKDPWGRELEWTK
ncbi:hypothetical protein [Aestuariispira insulae]|uniref:HNH endonuclease n=1 Tax=Aestuariispira insulae TaxID=1461337 RepID=A0A3D9HVP8_9PROT|nr:hypothetical protein [Aestuariispira insulae]RED53485.1 hypothetical protein DFP90_101274 [Aestuariispira insulae]